MSSATVSSSPNTTTTASNVNATNTNTAVEIKMNMPGLYPPATLPFVAMAHSPWTTCTHSTTKNTEMVPLPVKHTKDFYFMQFHNNMK